MDNVLTRKIGPLPGWAYAAIAAGGIFLLRRGSSSGAGSTSTGGIAAPVPTADGGNTSGADNSGAGGMPYGADFSNIERALGQTNATLDAINKKLPAGTPAKPAAKKPPMPKSKPKKGYMWVYRSWANKWVQLPIPKSKAAAPTRGLTGGPGGTLANATNN